LPRYKTSRQSDFRPTMPMFTPALPMVGFPARRVFERGAFSTVRNRRYKQAMEQNPPPPPFPSPDELKTKFTEFMKQNFGDRVSVAAFPATEPVESEAEEKAEKVDSHDFEFNFLPRDIKAHLDRFVIKQEEAKKVL